jgi:CYTH domain-containing protein
MRPRAQVGLRWVLRQIAMEKRRADAAFRERLHSDYSALSGRLRKSLSRYAVAVHDPSGGDRWAATAALLSHDAFQDLRDCIALVRDAQDDDHLHRARIAAKRLRYLLEPLAGALGQAPPALESLKRVQDLLGSVHDAHVFTRALRRHARALPVTHARGRADARPGFRALSARLARRRRVAWTTYTTEWLTSDFPALTEHVNRIVQDLRELAGTGVEIERKYLLRRLPPETVGAQSMVIDQGYIPGTTLVERVRRVEAADGVRHDRTVKSGTGLVRTELVEPCTPEAFTVLWPLTEGKRIRKRRYRLMDTGHVWEIDEFLDRRLVLAEIELASARDEVAIPGWLAKCVVREVTDDPEYLNYRLAR